MPNSKTSIRKRFIERRKAATEGQSSGPAASELTVANTERLLAQIFQEDQLAGQSCSGTRCVGLYSALPHEVPLAALATWLRNHKISHALPKIICPNSKAMAFVALDVSDASQTTKRGHFGIEELTAGYEVEPTILIVPLVAADLHGHRLGHGHGYYDRYIASLRKKNLELVTIGICYERQLYKGKLPAEAHDHPLDFIVTERKIYKCGS